NRLAALDPPKPPILRYERATPGELLHLDIKKLGRFLQPGVRATGDRSHRNPGAGVESLHVAIDDHSRLAFACLLPDEKTPSVLAALHQTLAFYQAHGILIQQVLTDAAPLSVPSSSPLPASNWASAISSLVPIAPKPTARPNASSRP